MVTKCGLSYLLIGRSFVPTQSLTERWQVCIYLNTKDWEAASDYRKALILVLEYSLDWWHRIWVNTFNLGWKENQIICHSWGRILKSFSSYLHGYNKNLVFALGLWERWWSHTSKSKKGNSDWFLFLFFSEKCSTTIFPRLLVFRATRSQDMGSQEKGSKMT